MNKSRIKRNLMKIKSYASAAAIASTPANPLLAT